MDWRRKAGWKFATFDAEGYRRRCDFFSLSLIFKIFIFVAFWNVCKDKLFIHKPIRIRPDRPVGCSDGGEREASRLLPRCAYTPTRGYLPRRPTDEWSNLPTAPSQTPYRNGGQSRGGLLPSGSPHGFSPVVLPSGSLSLCPAVGAALAHSSPHARALGYTVSIHYEDSSPSPSRFSSPTQTDRYVQTHTGA